MFRTVKVRGKDVRVFDLTAEKTEWRIEHETRGCFKEFHRNAKNEYVPRFGWSGLRTDPDVWVTRSADEATEMILRVMEHVPRAYLIKMLRK